MGRPAKQRVHLSWELTQGRIQIVVNHAPSLSRPGRLVRTATSRMGIRLAAEKPCRRTQSTSQSRKMAAAHRSWAAALALQLHFGFEM
jgi:hypothetical protein